MSERSPAGDTAAGESAAEAGSDAGSSSMPEAGETGPVTATDTESAPGTLSAETEPAAQGGQISAALPVAETDSSSELSGGSDNVRSAVEPGELGPPPETGPSTGVDEASELAKYGFANDGAGSPGVAESVSETSSGSGAEANRTEPGENDPVEPAYTNEADPRAAAADEPGDTPPEDPADPERVRPGDPARVRPGDPTRVQPGARAAGGEAGEGKPPVTAETKRAGAGGGDTATKVKSTLEDDRGFARNFASNAEGGAYGKATWDGPQQKLSGEERTALYGYSAEKAPGEAGPPDYKEINAYLRGSTPGSAEVTTSIEQMDHALSIQPVPENLAVLRETGESAFDRPIERLPGTVQSDPGYLSTALGPEPDFDSTKTKAVLHLEVPAGTPGMYMDGVSEYSSERELLLGRGLSYQVDRVENVDGRWHVYGRVLP